jgi:uncharacterized repeat protein (TIGR03803 family)
VVHSFGAGECGNPRDGLIEAHGLLYGVTLLGGAAQDGCVYSVDPANGQFSSLHQFSGAPYDGAAGLTKSGPDIYGVAAGGGVFGLGSIYRYHPATGTGETLYSFDGADGGRPSGALTEVGGLFYGTTATGGAANVGTVFSFDPKRRVMTILHDFSTTGPGGSSSRLVFAAGALFGLTTSDAFEIDLASLRYRAIPLPSRSSGAASDLTLANGLLYGVAQYGGNGGGGSVFGIDPETGKATILYNFPPHKDGFEPNTDLTYSNGLFYGLTAATGYPYYAPSTFYQFDPATHVRTTLHKFHIAMPTNLALTPVGEDLRGAAYVLRNGAYLGAIMRLDPATDAVTFDHVMQLGIYPPVTPLVRADHGFYFDTQAPCPGCTVPTAGMLYKLTR